MMCQRVRQIMFVTLVAGVTSVLAACSGTDVELKGGVFDLMGMSGNLAAKQAEPEMPDRPGLVMPPSTASLPKPGSAPQPAIAANGDSFPVNPEDAKRAQTENIVERHKAFCEQARQRQIATQSPTVESSPWGSCHESVLRNVTGVDLSGHKAPGAQ